MAGGAEIVRGGGPSFYACACAVYGLFNA